MSHSPFSVNPESADPLPPNCMTQPLSTREGLSALADNALEGQALAALLDACREDEAALDCWATYQLIGEALRAPALPGVALGSDMAFVSRLGRRLAQEAVAPPLAAELPRHRAEAANDGSFRWKLLASVASLAAVSAIAWSASGLLAPPLAGPQLAQASSAPLLVASPAGAMVRDARLEELLAAHKQFGARSALQEPSGFLRNATFDMPQATAAGR